MEKKIVLHLLSNNTFGGAENVVCQISHLVQEDGRFDVIYCSPDGPIQEILQKRMVKYSPIKKMTLVELDRIIKEIKPDIIHAHDMKASVMAAAVKGKVPLISHIHNNSIELRRLTFKTVVYCWAALKAEKIFWVSESALASYYFGWLFSKKSSVLPNAVNMDMIRLQAAEMDSVSIYDVVYIGGIRYPKNPQRLITVLENSIRMRPALQAAIIGTGDMEEEIRRMITARNLEKNIHLLGFMSNPYGILSRSKVMLLTSRWEGMPLCVLEAMTLGVPVVSTPVTGVCDIIVDGENGFLSNDDHQLAKCIVQLVDDDKLQQKMRKKQIQKACILNDIAMYRENLLLHYRRLSETDKIMS